MKFINQVLNNSLASLVLYIAAISLLQASDYTELSETDDLIIEGQIEYQQSCAVCHGEKGNGDGPYAAALVVKPADLTTLTTDNDGQFPFFETYLSIDGREMNKYHGTSLMPVWGNRFNQESWSLVSPEYANTLVRGRIFELLLYLYSIQDVDTNN